VARRDRALQAVLRAEAEAEAADADAGETGGAGGDPPETGRESAEE
jgi:hypothetical protein